MSKGFIRFLRADEIDYISREGTFINVKEFPFIEYVPPKKLDKYKYLDSFGYFCEQGAIVDNALCTIIWDETLHKNPFLVKTKIVFISKGLFCCIKENLLDKPIESW